MATILLLTITTIPLPVYGLLAEKYNIVPLAIGASLSMLVLLYPLYNVINLPHQKYTLLIIGLSALCISCITAIWPYFISSLFPTRIRYTCVGLSFNIADGIVGGFSSLISFYFINMHESSVIFVWIILISCIISIASCLKMKLIKISS